MPSDTLVLDRSPLGAVRTAVAAEPRILLTTPVPQQKTARTKARADVLHQLRQMGYDVLDVPARADPGPWLRLARELGEIPMRVDDRAYRAMVRNIAPLGEAVRRGDFLHDALVRLLR